MFQLVFLILISKRQFVYFNKEEQGQTGKTKDGNDSRL